MDLKALKEDTAYISKGIEEINRKLETLCTTNHNIGTDSLLDFLKDLNTLSDDINTVLEVTRDNTKRQKQLLSESEIVIEEVSEQITKAENIRGVAVVGEVQQLTPESSEREDETSEEQTTTTTSSYDDSEFNLSDVYDLLNKSPPKLL